MTMSTTCTFGPKGPERMSDSGTEEGATALLLKLLDVLALLKELADSGVQASATDSMGHDLRQQSAPQVVSVEECYNGVLPGTESATWVAHISIARFALPHE